MVNFAAIYPASGSKPNAPIRVYGITYYSIYEHPCRCAHKLYG